MSRFVRVSLITVLCATSCFAQTGTVTFYSRGFSVKSEAKVFLPKSEQPFGGLQGGWLLDGSQRLARVRAGRFVTFHFSPGEHSFSDAGPTGPSRKPVVIEVKDGARYCVRLFAKMTNLGWENQIEEVPCQQAQREAAHLKSVELKHVEPAVRAELDPATSFPGTSQAHQ